ncbi:MAG: WD40 repeat domain-containing protein [Candidatus Poribacteria bacterium]|nr:WD40 repeat domain-containing protein [Candidatus Poribacteria bacterium]
MENRTAFTPALRPFDDTDVTTWELPEGAIARLGRGRLFDLSFSPDGRYLAVATTIGCWLYDLPTLKPLTLFEAERGMIQKIVFSRDAQWIATSNADGIVRVSDTQTLQCITKIDFRASALHFSQDGQYLAMSSHRESAIYSWRTNTDEPILWFPIEAEDTKGHRFPICFSPNGNLLAYVSSVSPQDTITISDIDTGEHITDFSCPAPLGFQGIVFSPCGQYLASAHRNGDVQVCDVHNSTSEIVHTVSDVTYVKLAPDATYVKLAYTPDGTLHVAEIHGGKVVIWDAVQHEKIDTLEFEGNKAICCFSGDGTQFAIANSQEFRVWTADKSIRVVPMPDAHPSIVRWLRFSQQEKTLISGHSGHYTLFWSVVNHQTQRIFRPDTEGYSLGLRSVLSPCEEFLAAAVFGSRHSTDIVIVVWHITSGTLIAELTGPEKPVVQTAYSPTGDCLVSGSRSGELYVWDTQQWEKRHKLIGHTDGIRSAVFHPDGKQLVTASYDRTARVWNVENSEQVGSLPLDAILEDTSLYKGRPQEIQQFIDWKQKLGTQQPTFSNVGSIKFSPCGTLIAGRLSRERRWKGIANEIRLWDAETLETRMAILLPVDVSSTYALAFSPCGRYLASGTWWKKGLEKMSIHLWEVATGENVHTFWGHPTDIHDLAFSPDGELLASGSYDSTILLWDMKPFINS